MPDKDYSEQVADSMGIPVGEDAGEKDKPQLSEQLLQQLLQMANQPAQMPPAPQAMSIPEALALATMGTMYKSQMSRDLLHGYVLPELAQREQYPQMAYDAAQDYRKQRAAILGQAVPLAGMIENRRALELEKANDEQDFLRQLNYRAGLLGSYADEAEDRMGAMEQDIISSADTEQERKMLRRSFADQHKSIEKYRTRVAKITSDLSSGVHVPESVVAELEAVGRAYGPAVTGLQSMWADMMAAKAERGETPMPAGLVTASARAQSLISGLDKLEKWINQNPGVGGSFQTLPFRKALADPNSPAGQFANLIGLGDIARNQVQAEGDMALISSFLMNELSGAAISAAEMERLKIFLPDIAAGDFSNLTNIKRLGNFLRSNLAVIQSRGAMIESVMQRTGLPYEQAKSIVLPDVGGVDPSIELNWGGFPATEIPEGFSVVGGAVPGSKPAFQPWAAGTLMPQESKKGATEIKRTPTMEHTRRYGP